MTTSSNATTTWSVSVDATSKQSSLKLSTNGGPAAEMQLKGVCYSPCPLNGSNGFGPSLGDWFWDSFSGPGYAITGWTALWQRDLPNIRTTLGANTIRVYNIISRQLNADGSYPTPWNSGQLFTHTTFLDQCWNGGMNPLYVLVGIATPQALFCHQDYQPDSPLVQFWTNVLQETAAQLSKHPAVLGFIIQNEWDSNVVTYGSNTADVEFWWSQVEAMAQLTKSAAPDKLVGMAVHDDPNICGQAAAYMAKCPHLDFWGVNTYQTQSFSSVFDAVPKIGPGYSGLSGAALKPVILTEYGIPATGHHNPSDPSTIYADATTIEKTAGVLNTMLPQAYAEKLCLGLYYFEYCDEWWNQGGAPNIFTWWGGAEADGFPNGFWDQDGFGLYGIARGPGLSNDAPIWQQNGGYGQPATPIDVHSERTPLTAALRAAFAAH